MCLTKRCLCRRRVRKSLSNSRDTLSITRELKHTHTHTHTHTQNRKKTHSGTLIISGAYPYCASITSVHIRRLSSTHTSLKISKMDLSIEDFVITEPKAIVASGISSARIESFEKQSPDEAIVTLKRSKFKGYKQVVETAHRPVDLLGGSEHCTNSFIDQSEITDPLEFCAMKCQEYSSLECTAFWIYADPPYRCCRKAAINLDACREPFPGVLYSVVETSRVSVELLRVSMQDPPVIFQWDEIDETIPRIELIQVLVRPFTIEDAEHVALSRGLSLGGQGYGFSGGYSRKGLYAYHEGTYGNMAFFGTGGTIASMTASLNGGGTYRPYDYMIQEIDASSLDVFNPLFSTILRVQTNKTVFGLNKRDIRILNDDEDKLFEVTYMASRGKEHVVVISRRQFLDRGPGPCVINSQSLSWTLYTNTTEREIREFCMRQSQCVGYWAEGLSRYRVYCNQSSVSFCDHAGVSVENSEHVLGSDTSSSSCMVRNNLEERNESTANLQIDSGTFSNANGRFNEESFRKNITMPSGLFEMKISVQDLGHSRVRIVLHSSQVLSSSTSALHRSCIEGSSMCNCSWIRAQGMSYYNLEYVNDTAIAMTAELLFLDRKQCVRLVLEQGAVVDLFGNTNKEKILPIYDDPETTEEACHSMTLGFCDDTNTIDDDVISVLFTSSEKMTSFDRNNIIVNGSNANIVTGFRNISDYAYVVFCVT